MAYQNKNGQPRQRCMLVAHALINDFAAKQTDVAEIFDCSRSTIHKWNKEVTYLKRIDALNVEIENVRGFLR